MSLAEPTDGSSYAQGLASRCSFPAAGALLYLLLCKVGIMRSRHPSLSVDEVWHAMPRCLMSHEDQHLEGIWNTSDETGSHHWHECA